MKRRKTKVYLDDVKEMLLNRRATVMGEKATYNRLCEIWGIDYDPKTEVAIKGILKQLDSLLREADDLEIA